MASHWRHNSSGCSQLSEVSSVRSLLLDADDLNEQNSSDMTSPALLSVKAIMTQSKGGQRVLCTC
jgi:hypothetical protein